jgi:hypothetical protein
MTPSVPRILRALRGHGTLVLGTHFATPNAGQIVTHDDSFDSSSSADRTVSEGVDPRHRPRYRGQKRAELDRG